MFVSPYIRGLTIKFANSSR